MGLVFEFFIDRRCAYSILASTRCPQAGVPFETVDLMAYDRLVRPPRDEENMGQVGLVNLARLVTLPFLVGKISAHGKNT